MSSDLNASTATAADTGPCATSGSIPPLGSNLSPTPQTTRDEWTQWTANGEVDPAPTSQPMAPTSQPMAPTPSPTPLRVKSLAPLLLRDNVKAILGLAGVKSIAIAVRFADGRTDNKTIALADGGSLALLLLDDNPDAVPTGAFYDIRP